MKLFAKLTLLTFVFFCQLNSKAQIIISYPTVSTPTPATSANFATIGSLTSVNGVPTTTFAGTLTPSTGYSGASGTTNGNLNAKIGVLSTVAAGSSYIQVVLTPAANYYINVSNINWGNLSLSTTGPTLFSIYASNDNFITSTLINSIVAPLSTSTWGLLTPVTPAVSFNGLSGTALTIRIMHQVVQEHNRLLVQ
jgi:hypothetical protein